MNEDKLLEALKTGIIVKRRDDEGEHNVFYGDELYIVYCRDEYCLGVRSRGGYLKASEYGTVWTLRPNDTSKSAQDTLFEDLYLENFQ